MKRVKSSLPVTLCLLGGMLITTAVAVAGEVVGGMWVPQGQSPTTNGQVEGLVDGEVVGAIQTVVAHPTDPDILYVGGANGGVWKTTDATSASPTWALQSGSLGSLSIGALDLDPTDGTSNTVVAGIGRFSSLSRLGGQRIGILRTIDGGASWVEVDDGGALDGLNIYAVAARGATILVSVDAADSGNAARGIYRSTTTGSSWTKISSGDGSVTGLPGGKTYDLSGSRMVPTTLYTAVLDAEAGGGVSGVYRSADTGAGWTKVSDAAIDAALLSGLVSNLEISVGTDPGVNVYVGIVTSGQLSHVFRSGDDGASWTAMGLPSDGFAGAHPGSQGGLHFSLIADPSNANLVYVGGDRQSLPNGVGASDYSGRLFRGDASQAPGSQWVHLTHRNDLGPSGGGTANTTAPHADSRDMAIDAAGELIETDDGGVYRRTSPQDNTGDWFSINGNIRTAEAHDAGYDANSDILAGGHQDTGSSAQIASGGERWKSISTADGGDIGVDDISTPGLSTRFSSYQVLQVFRRQVFDAANVSQSVMFPSLTVIGGGQVLSAQFVTPIKVNAVDGDRLVIGASNGVYESFDQGDTVTQLTPIFPVNATTSQPLLYGAGDNPDLIWAGSSNSVRVRTGAPPATFTTPGTYPGTATVRDIAVDPSNSSTVFVADSNTVYRSPDGGASWVDIGAGLATYEPGTLRSIAYLEAPSGDGLAVGTSRGVLLSMESEGFTTWRVLGSGLPTVPVFDLDYDAASDLLVAGTLGTGAYRLETVLGAGPIFSDGFESGDTSAWTNAIGAAP